MRLIAQLDAFHSLTVAALINATGLSLQAIETLDSSSSHAESCGPVFLLMREWGAFAMRHRAHNNHPVSDNPLPKRLNLIKDQKLEIDWDNGRQSVYSMSYLRWMCPCALCKTVRKTDSQASGKKTLLKVLPGNSLAPVRAESAELVGNYALRIDWSDQHGSGIYSFAYLYDIAPEMKQEPARG